jgi:hypothetical protein
VQEATRRAGAPLVWLHGQSLAKQPLLSTAPATAHVYRAEPYALFVDIPVSTHPTKHIEVLELSLLMPACLPANEAPRCGIGRCLHGDLRAAGQQRGMPSVRAGPAACGWPTRPRPG